MFKNLKKKLEQGVSQSSLKNVISSATKAPEGSPTSADVSYNTDLSLDDSSISAYSTPIKDGHGWSNDDSSVAVDPRIGQLIDIPLSSDSSPVHVPDGAVGGRSDRERHHSAGSNTSDSALFPPLNLSQNSFYVPSDVESVTSEFDGSTLTTEGYTKDDLYRMVQKQQRKAHKYKNKFQELVAAYKSLTSERDKIKSTLTQSQDRAFRRISELREQIALDQEAKKDVEQNYQLMLEEKTEALKVLKTQVNLLKSSKEEVDEPASPTKQEEVGGDGHSKDVTALRDKVTKLETLLGRCKDTIKANREKLSAINKEKLELEKTVEEKDKLLGESLESQEKGAAEKSKLKAQIDEARRVIEEIESDKVISIATVKQKMHESLEEKDGELERSRSVVRDKEEEVLRLREEVGSVNEEIELLKKSGEEQLEKAREIIRRLKDEKKGVMDEADSKLRSSEDKLEQEKQELIQEISRGKAAALSLLQEETEQRVLKLTEEHNVALAERDASWEGKIASLKATHEEDLVKKHKEMEHVLMQKEEEVMRRLREKEEEMGLAMEERDLQKMAALSQQDDRTDEITDGFMQQMNDLRAEKIRLENTLSKLQDDSKNQFEKLNSEHDEIVNTLRAKFEKCENEYNNTITATKHSHETQLQLSMSEKSAEIETLQVKYKELEESSAATKDMLEGRVHTLMAQVKQQGDNAGVTSQRVLELESELEAFKVQLKASSELCLEKDRIVETEKEKLGTLGTEAKRRIRELKEGMDQLVREHEAALAAKEKKFFDELSRKDTEINTLTLRFESEKVKELQELKDDVARYQGIAESLKTQFDEKKIEFSERLKKIKEEYDVQIRSKDQELDQVIAEVRHEENERIEEVESKWRANLKDVIKEWGERVEGCKSSSQLEVEEIRKEHVEIQERLKSEVKEVTEKFDSLSLEKGHVDEMVGELRKLLDVANEKNRLVTDQRDEFEVEIGELRKEIENRLTQAIQSQSDEMNLLQDKLASCEKGLSEKDAELSSLKLEHEKSVEALRLEHVVHVEEIQLAVMSQKSAAEEELEVNYKSQLECVKVEQQKINDDLIAAYKNIEGLNDVMRGLNETIIAKDNNIETQKSELEDVRKQLVQIENDNAKISEIHREVINERDCLGSEISEIKEVLQRAELSLQEKDCSIAEYKQEINILESAKLSLEEKVFAFDNESMTKDEKHQVLLDSLQALRSELDERIRVCNDQEKSYESLKGAIEVLKQEKEDSFAKMQCRIDELILENNKIKEELLSKELMWNESLSKAETDRKDMEENYRKSIDAMKEENNDLVKTMDENASVVTAKLGQFEDAERHLQKELAEAKEFQEEQRRALQEKDDAYQKLQERFDNLKSKAQAMVEKLRTEKEDMGKLLEELRFEKENVEKTFKENLIELKNNENTEKTLHENLLKLQSDKDDLERDLNEKFKKIAEEHSIIVESLKKEHSEKLMSMETDIKEKMKVMKEKDDLHEKLKQDYDEAVKLHDVKVNDLTSDIEIRTAEFAEERNRLQQNLRDLESDLKVRSEDLQRSMQSNLSDSQKQIMELHERHSQKLASTEDIWRQKLQETKQKYVQKLKEMQSQHVEKLSITKSDYEQKWNEVDNENIRLKDDLEKEKSNSVARINELNVLNDNMSKEISVKDNRLKELERELKGALDETQRLYSELNVTNKKLLQFEELGKLTDDKIENLEKTNEEFLRELDIRKEKIEILTSELGHVNRVRDEMQGLERAVQERDGLIASLRSDLQSAADEQNKLNEDIDRIVLESKNKAIELQSEISEINAKHDKDLDSLTEKLGAESEAKVAEYKKKAEMYLSQMKKQFLTDKETAVSDLESIIVDLKSRVETMSVEITTMKSERESLEMSHMQALENIKEEYESLLKGKATELSDIVARAESNDAEQNEMLTENQSLKHDKDALNERISMLEKEKVDAVAVFEAKITLIENEKAELGRTFYEFKKSADEERGELLQKFDHDVNHLRKDYEVKMDILQADNSTKVKQLVREFNSSLEAKDQEFQDHVNTVMEKSERDGDRIGLEHKSKMAELYNDLHEKDVHLENILEEHRNAMQSKDEEMRAKSAEHESLILALRTELNSMESRHAADLASAEDSIEERVRNRMLVQQEEIQGLTAEWQQERRLQSAQNTDALSPEEMLRQNERALSVIQSGSASGEKLKQTLVEMSQQQQKLSAQHELEIAELRSQLDMKGSSKPLVAPPGERDVFSIYEKDAAEEIQNLELHNLDLERHVAQLNNELQTSSQRQAALQQQIARLESDLHASPAIQSDDGPSSNMFEHGFPAGPLLNEPTEMEYLRNILYEYMMGRETKTLAKVLTTVMRFSEEQTRKVLQRENSLIEKWLPPPGKKDDKPYHLRMT